MDLLIQELKSKIVNALELTDIIPEDIGDDDPLIGGKLEIDSIDILELVMMIEADYSLLIDNKEIGAKVFASVRSLAEFIQEQTLQKSAELSRAN